MTASNPHIKKLFEFLKIARWVEKTPGFSSVLGLTRQNLEAAAGRGDVRMSGRILEIQLCPSPSLVLPGQNDQISLSTYLALMDETTTFALLLADPSRARPGVSISLNMHRRPGARNYKLGDPVVILSSTSKVGRNVGFAEAEIRSVGSNELICYGSQVKYLPMSLIAELMLSSYGWPLTVFCADWYSKDSKDLTSDVTLADAMASFRFDDKQNCATFEALPLHASPGGPVHGGCQAILMELSGRVLAQRIFGPDAVIQMESITIECLAKPNKKHVDLELDVMFQTDFNLTTRVKMLCDGKVKSIGKLQFVQVNSNLTQHAKL